MKDAPVLGSYVVADTPASRVDARVKILLLVGVTVAVFAASGPLCLVLVYGLLAVGMASARVDALSVARALRPAALVLAFVLCANLISCDGSAELVVAGPFGLSLSGAVRGAAAVLRIGLFVGAALVVAASTTTTELADAFVRLLSPLAVVGVPVPAVGMALSVALRFVPLVAEEFGRIRMAQQARGVRFDDGALAVRLRRWTAVFAPLIVGLLRRADELAESMEARCYAGQMQTCRKPLARSDWIVLAAGSACLAFAVLVG